MTTRRRGRSSFRRSGTRRQNQWGNTGGVETAVVPGGQAILRITQNGLPLGWVGTGLTIARLIGEFAYRSSANVEVAGTIGVGVVSTDAAVAGAVPEPTVDLLGWYFWARFNWRRNTTDYEYNHHDIRSARRITNERELVFVIDADVANTTDVTFTYSARFLARK